MKHIDPKVSNELAKIDKLTYTFDKETISVIFELAKVIKSRGDIRTIDTIINNTFQGYASQLCVGEALKQFGEVDRPSVQRVYNEWKLREKKHGDYRFYNGRKIQVKSMNSFKKDISMSFDHPKKYDELVKTCDPKNAKYSEYILITRCAPLIKRKEYVVSASALLSTYGLLRYVKQYGSLYHLQTANLYRRGMLEWYDKDCSLCDEDGNYHSDIGVIIKRHKPSADLSAFLA